MGIIRWGCAEFQRFLILIADDLQAYTFAAIKQVDFSTALAKARAIGDERFASITRSVSSLGVRNCHIARWRELEGNGGYGKIVELLKVHYATDKHFCEDVLTQVRWRNNTLREYEPIAAQYVLRELAAMVFLQEIATPRWPIQVFPLPMPPALRDLYKGTGGIQPLMYEEKSGYIHLACLRAQRAPERDASPQDALLAGRQFQLL